MTERGWLGVQLSQFVQNDREITLEDGTVFPPSYNWYADLTAKRSDGVHFFVKVRIFRTHLDDAVRPGAQVQLAGNMIAQALLQLESYRNCDCQVGVPCTLHKEPR